MADHRHGQPELRAAEVPGRLPARLPLPDARRPDGVHLPAAHRRTAAAQCRHRRRKPRAAAYGDFLDKDARYRRTGEFLSVVRELGTARASTCTGSICGVEEARLSRPPEPVPRGVLRRLLPGGRRGRGPARRRTLTLGRAARAGRRRRPPGSGSFAARHGPHPALRHPAARHHPGHRRAGLGGGGPDARRLRRGDRTGRATGPRPQRVGGAAAHARPARRQPGEPGDPLNLWAGVGLVRGGAGTALVGSHDEVVERIKEYHALGIDEFVLSGHPHPEEAYWFGEGVPPRLAAQGLWAAPRRPADRRPGAGAVRGLTGGDPAGPGRLGADAKRDERRDRGRHFGAAGRPGRCTTPRKSLMVQRWLRTRLPELRGRFLAPGSRCGGASRAWTAPVRHRGRRDGGRRRRGGGRRVAHGRPVRRLPDRVERLRRARPRALAQAAAVRGYTPGPATTPLVVLPFTLWARAGRLRRAGLLRPTPPRGTSSRAWPAAVAATAGTPRHRPPPAAGALSGPPGARGRCRFPVRWAGWLSVQPAAAATGPPPHSGRQLAQCPQVCRSRLRRLALDQQEQPFPGEALGTASSGPSPARRRPPPPPWWPPAAPVRLRPHRQPPPARASDAGRSARA